MESEIADRNLLSRGDITTRVKGILSGIMHKPLQNIGIEEVAGYSLWGAHDESELVEGLRQDFGIHSNGDLFPWHWSGLDFSGNYEGEVFGGHLTTEACETLRDEYPHVYIDSSEKFNGDHRELKKSFTVGAIINYVQARLKSNV